MAKPEFKQSQLIVCINNEGLPKTLEIGKAYRVIMKSSRADLVVIEAGGRVSGFESKRFESKETYSAKHAT